MTQPHRALLATLSVSAWCAFVLAAFLLPRGEGVGHAALVLALLGAAAAALAYTYAHWTPAAVPERDETLHPEIDTVITDGHVVPESILAGSAPLIAVVREGELLHPAFVDSLAPYFTERSLGFVQAATRYDGVGRVADAFRIQQTLLQNFEHAKNSLNAVMLRGSGALIAREALEQAYRPGIGFAELGLRMQALGYTSHAETRALTLAWAPETLEEYWPHLLRNARRSYTLLYPALRTKGLSFATRLQYAAIPSAYTAAVAGTLALVLTPPALVLRGVGPVILSGAALPALLVFVSVCLIAARMVEKIAAVPAAPVVSLVVSGTALAGYRLGLLFGKKIKVRATPLLQAGAAQYANARRVLLSAAKKPQRGQFLLAARETGLEPATSAVTGRRSNQLSYSRVSAEGLAPSTLGL